MGLRCVLCRDTEAYRWAKLAEIRTFHFLRQDRVELTATARLE